MTDRRLRPDWWESDAARERASGTALIDGLERVLDVPVLAYRGRVATSDSRAQARAMTPSRSFRGHRPPACDAALRPFNRAIVRSVSVCA
jgi:hypothetical protein